MIQYIRNKEGEGGSYICTASLVNNTAHDKKPYVLSAFHCSQDILGEQTVTPEELAKNMWAAIMSHPFIR